MRSIATIVELSGVLCVVTRSWIVGEEGGLSIWDGVPVVTSMAVSDDELGSAVLSCMRMTRAGLPVPPGWKIETEAKVRNILKIKSQRDLSRRGHLVAVGRSEEGIFVTPNVGLPRGGFVSKRGWDRRLDADASAATLGAAVRSALEDVIEGRLE